MSGWSVNRGLMESTCINCIEELRPTSWKCWWRSQFFHCIYQPGIKPVNNLQDLFLSLIIIIIDLFPEINLIPGLSLTTASPGHWKKDPGACGHVTTQNLRGKKICWTGRGGRAFWLLLWWTWWVSKPQAVAKTYPLVSRFIVGGKVCVTGRRTWPAATRIFLPMTERGRGERERAWEQGWAKIEKHRPC